MDSLLKEIRYANGATLTASYDLVGNLTAETDPEGNATAYEYDPVGRMTAVTDALGNTTRYEYDAADNLAKVTDALGHVTSYTYDALGNLTSETDALGNTVKYSYTPEGWLETVTDAEGHVTRYTYDKTGNVLTADYAGEQTETNTYNELGLLTTVTTAEGDTLYQYDDASRLISVTQPNGETVSYTYDSHGNRATMTYPNGKTVKYTYDDMNRLIAVKGIDGETTKYEYDALGRRIATDGAKEDTVYTYDEVGNLVSQTTTGAYDLALEYAYDLSGRMTSESRTENGATLTSNYIYDALGQLTGFTRSDGQSETYTYDPVGNMTAKTQNGVSTAMRYNAANQLIQSVSGTDKTTYTYDANGNLVRSENAVGARSYAYNALNLLQSFTREDGYTEIYTYNANRLLSEIRTSEDLTTTLTWDILYGDGVVISAAQNGQQTSYTYGLERISAQTGNTRTEYVYDGRGSVAAEVSYNNAWYTFGGGLARKNVVSKSYSPFGELLTEQTSGFGYNGEYYNAATGMIYLRARFYEPEMNRFGQKDLLRGSAFAPQSLNRYLYVQNDPMNLIDTSGMSLKSLWEKGKNAVSNAVQSFVSNPVGTIVNTGRTVINAVTHPVTTAKNIVTTTGKIITELFTPDPKPQTNTPTASPSGNRGTSYDTNISDSGQDRDRQTAMDTILSSNEEGDPSSVTQGVNQVSSKSPSVQDITNTPAACSFWERMAQGEMARVQQQQLEAAAMADAFLGAINTVGRNGIDLINAIVDVGNALNRRLSIPLRINRINESVKQNLEQLTRRLASNDVSYDVGQLGGDVATTIIEYVGLIKAAKGLTGVLKKAPEILSSLSSFGRILLPAGGPPLESAIAVAGTATQAGTFAEGLVLFGDILFNYSAFKKDVQTLKNDFDSQNSSSSDAPSGEWQDVNEYMPDESRAYQTQITGEEGKVWVQNGVKFDGIKDGTLIETKGHYEQFVNPETGQFYEWFTGQDGFLDQARRQLGAAEGAQVRWYFAEESVMEATEILFERNGISGIELVFEAIK